MLAVAEPACQRELDDVVKRRIDAFLRPGYLQRADARRVDEQGATGQRKQFAMGPREDLLWRNFAYAAFLLLALLFVLPSSTVVDRLALYILPIQLVVISRLPRLGFGLGIGRMMAVGYSFAVLFVWLNYAVHADHWIPYRLFPVFG